jgi:hypothetical protein
MMELRWLVYLRKIVVFYTQSKLKLCWMNVVFFIKNRIKLPCSLPLNLVEY